MGRGETIKNHESKTNFCYRLLDAGISWDSGTKVQTFFFAYHVCTLLYLGTSPDCAIKEKLELRQCFKSEAFIL